MFLSLLRYAAAFFLTFSVMDNVAAFAEKGRSKVHELVVRDAGRSYLVYRPAAAGPGNAPLMIVLHGGLGNARHVEKMTGMNDVADTGGFLVAYPNGTGGRFRAMENLRTWNAGSCCGQAARQNIDDVSFIAKMIEDIHAHYSIDTRRVYVAGMSNGAMMAYRLACEIPDRIAAIITVSGTLAVDTCDAAKDIPVLHIHGDQDRYVPFGGGKGEKSVSGEAHRSVPDTIDLIIRPRQCGPPGKKSLEGGIDVFSYRCKNGAPVELYVINGGGHSWPGGHGRGGNDPDGRTFSASRQAWEFSKQFSKKN
ncbi:MAG: prolyl oligopeptidase family serine peptidase [Alphaproteobacteria bacterium]|uniref:Prolyl oligopeptidase family serine peptidase n=1 Tax=Candidatus Nitrobium versatile TaxID=2884831 RepID=A0A953J8E3_9BACT|nr:prolyl oligopeptidase family serine peptidase [Candidatus Nitrobium versatile]